MSVLKGSLIRATVCFKSERPVRVCDRGTRVVFGDADCPEVGPMLWVREESFLSVSNAEA